MVYRRLLLFLLLTLAYPHQGFAGTQPAPAPETQTEQAAQPHDSFMKKIKNFCTKKVVCIGVAAILASALIFYRFKHWQKEQKMKNNLLSTLPVPDYSSDSSTPGYLIHKPIEVKEKIEIREKSVSGAISTLTIKQIEVENQRGTTCGYHALINALRIMRACQGPVFSAELLQNIDLLDEPGNEELIETTVKKLRGIVADWQKNECYDAVYRDYKQICRAALQQEDEDFNSYEPPTLSTLTDEQRERIREYCREHNEREKYLRCITPADRVYQKTCKENNIDPQANWTSRNHLEQLIDHLRGEGSIGVGDYTRVIDNDDLTHLIEYCNDNYPARHSEETRRYYDIVHPLRNKDVGIYPLVVMTGENHWFTLVVHRESAEQVTYFLADSLGNSERWHNTTIQAFIRMIETPDIKSSYEALVAPYNQNASNAHSNATSFWGWIKSFFV